MSLTLILYRFMSRMAGPIAKKKLLSRVQKGKEDPSRLNERLGHPSLPRPDGPMIWVHAASVGESLSILPLIGAIRRDRPDIETLVTTGTVTSAQLMQDRLPEGAAHQYIPVDTIGAVRRFLRHWQPDLCIFVESDIWPTLVIETNRMKAPMVLVNGRISESSFKKWRTNPGMIKNLLRRFDMVLAQNNKFAERFIKLGANKKCVKVTGNLKEAAEPLPVYPDQFEQLQQSLAGRPRWLAASTHAGEEIKVATAHEEICGQIPNLLTMIAPRHPERGPEIADKLAMMGFNVSLRSRGDIITQDTAIYIADTLGEMGLWYRLNSITFMGGSLVPIGGHNLLEAARLGSTLVSGSHIFNFADVYEKFQQENAVKMVGPNQTLAGVVSSLLDKEGMPNKEATEIAKSAFELSKAGDSVLQTVLQRINKFLPAERP